MNFNCSILEHIAEYPLKIAQMCYFNMVFNKFLTISVDNFVLQDVVVLEAINTMAQ